MRGDIGIMNFVFKLSLLVLFVMLALGFVSLSVSNEELLKQVDEAQGKYNEVKYDRDLLQNKYEQLQKDYEYAIEIIRTLDKVKGE